jgi:hypothetical protein
MTMAMKNILAAGLIAASVVGAAFAAGDRGDRQGERSGDDHARHMHGAMRHASVEMTAMHNILADLLSAKTGKSAGEVKALFEKSDNPHEAMESLGLSRDDMRTLHDQARAKLIDKAATAGLITAEQATQLRAAKLPRHGPRPPRDDDEGNDGDDRRPRGDDRG